MKRRQRWCDCDSRHADRIYRDSWSLFDGEEKFFFDWNLFSLLCKDKQVAAGFLKASCDRLQVAINIVNKAPSIPVRDIRIDVI